MIRIDTIWLALGASDLRGGIDRLLAMVVHGFALGAQPHQPRAVRLARCRAAVAAVERTTAAGHHDHLRKP